MAFTFDLEINVVVEEFGGAAVDVDPDVDADVDGNVDGPVVE